MNTSLLITQTQLSEIPPLDLAALYVILENNRIMGGTTINRDNPFMRYHIKEAMITNYGGDETEQYIEQARRFLQGE